MCQRFRPIFENDLDQKLETLSESFPAFTFQKKINKGKRFTKLKPNFNR